MLALLRKIWLPASILAIVGIVFFVQINRIINRFEIKIETVSSVKTAPVVLVFGAGIRSDGSLSHALQDRVDTAAALYQAGKAHKILMSGDNGSLYYDEVTAMKKYIVDTYKISADDVVLDYAGFDTYDSCYRARDIFLVQDAILVTQAFHLPRALFICDSLGINVQGVVADKRIYRGASRYELRELLARVKAGLEVYIFKSKPRFLGNEEPIF